MFSKLLVAATLATAVLSWATPTPPPPQCDVGELQCCDNVQPSDSDAISGLLAAVGANVQGLHIPVGVTCTPITVIGVGAASNCAAQPVCCENNNFNGVVALGCTPVNVGL